MRLTCIYLLFSISVFSQKSFSTPIEIEPSINNFNRVISAIYSTPELVDTMIALGYAYISVSSDTTLLLGKEAAVVVDKMTTNQKQAILFIEIGTLYLKLGNLEEAEVQLLKGKEIATNSNQKDEVAKANNMLGLIGIDKGNYQAALVYFLDAIKIWEKSENYESIIESCLNIGNIYFNLGDLRKVQEYLNKAYDIAEKTDDDRAKMAISGKQAITYMYMAKPVQMVKDSLITTVENDSSDYFMKKANDEYENSLTIARRLNDNGNIVGVLNNIVVFKLNTGAFAEALELAKEAEEKAKLHGEIHFIIQSKYNLAYVYESLGQYKKGISYAKESLELAQKNGLERKQALANQALYELYKGMGRHDKALEYFEKSFLYEKKISDVEKNKAIAEIEGKFQNAQKQQQIMTQKNNILTLEATNAKITQQKNYLILASLVSGILVFFGFRFNKIRRERNDKKAFAEALIFAQEEERKRIARDLHDGVGQSLLLIKKQMESTHETTLENKSLISDTLDEVRMISRDLHPLQLEKFGLTTAINSVIEKIEKSTDLFITKEIENIDEVILKKNEIHIFRAIQEALSNIVKHAEATAAKVNIVKVGNEVIIKVMDNGKGYDHELTVINSKSLGLRTINERISSIGGRLKIEQNIPSGTLITFTIPKNNKVS